MPSTTRLVQVTLPEAEMLADLYSVRFDLNLAAELCEKAIGFSQTSNDAHLVEGLVYAAVIRYGRCFSTGARLGLRREDIGTLNDGDLEIHDFFKALRDKFVAHSVNVFEETIVTAAAAEQDGVKLPIRSVGPGQNRVVLHTDTARSLNHLIVQVKAVVEKRVIAEEQRLLEFIGTLPIETIHAGDLYTAPRLSDKDVHRPRIQTRRSRGQASS